MMYFLGFIGAEDITPPVYTPGKTRTPSGKPGFIPVFNINNSRPIDYERTYVPDDFYKLVAREATDYGQMKYAEECGERAGLPPPGNVARAFQRIGLRFTEEHIIAWRTCRLIMYALHGIKYDFR